MTQKKKNAQQTTNTATLMSDVMGKFPELPKKITKNILSVFLESVENNVATGCKVRIDKLGILAVKDRAARVGRNPKTGEAVQIPPSKKVGFRAAASLKQAIGIKKQSMTTKKKS